MWQRLVDSLVFGVLGAGAGGYGGSIATAIAKVFDLTVACTGLSEKACAREALECDAVIVHPSSHAGYYPDAADSSGLNLFV